MELGVRRLNILSCLVTRLAVKSSASKSQALSSIYTRMNVTLIRANAKDLLSRVTLG